MRVYLARGDVPTLLAPPDIAGTIALGAPVAGLELGRRYDVERDRTVVRDP